MRYETRKVRLCAGLASALTFVEMVIALSIMAIIFAVVLPQFRAIQNSWDSKAGAAEALQNGRVLMDHLYHNLSKAARITVVSDSAENNGYIEFQDNAGDTLRYDISEDSYVEFGPVGDLCDLAGQVRQLQFICYDANDFNTPITDVNTIRFVKVKTTLTNLATLGQDKIFTAWIYLRANSISGGGEGVFGNQNVENISLSGKDVQFATQVSLAEDETVTSISAYVQKGPDTGRPPHPPQNLRYAIYTDNNGEPGTLIVQSAAEAVESTFYHWHEVSITPTEFSAGTYWLALAFDNDKMMGKQSLPGSGQTRHKSNNAVANGFLSSWGTSDESNTRRLSIYATCRRASQILP